MENQNSNYDTLLDNWHDLLFAVRRSIRYHTLRREFYDRWGVILGILIILTGSGSAAALGAGAEAVKPVGVIAGAVVALLSAFDLIVGFSKKSREHHDLARDFCSLEAEMIGKGDLPSTYDLVRCTQRRLEIEKIEPPKKCALDVICHNEEINATDGDPSHMVPLQWYHRILAQVCRFNGDTFKKVRNL